jgi:hypothetical protein
MTLNPINFNYNIGMIMFTEINEINNCGAVQALPRPGQGCARLWRRNFKLSY